MVIVLPLKALFVTIEFIVHPYEFQRVKEPEPLQDKD
jgi:hypothetical protein